MDLNYFKKTRILDGGMGQELLSRGMDPEGTLWSAKALIEEKYHSLIKKIHEDFIKAGAEVIVTATFTARRIRLRENGLEDQFENLNIKAGEIAQSVKKDFPKILVAGGLPPQYLTYEADTRPTEEIYNNYNEQAKILNPYVDFFYLDVLSSVNEIQTAINAISQFNKPYLIGAHISEGNTLPSGEKITDIIKKIEHKKFSNILDYLKKNDLLILNNTKVFPARLYATKDRTDAKVEIFLLRELGDQLWEVLVKPARKVRIGNKLNLADGIYCDVIDNTVSGGRVVRFEYEGDFDEILHKIGHPPLPPYIEREPVPSDSDRFQTEIGRAHV